MWYVVGAIWAIVLILWVAGVLIKILCNKIL